MSDKQIFDDIFKWEGWGGKLRLGSGRCRLRIYDLTKGNINNIKHLHPIIVVVSDVPGSKLSIRSCAGHIATSVTRDFNIDHHRMLFVEYYPEASYGAKRELVIPERFDAVDFSWQEEKAIQPKWRGIKPAMKDIISKLIND